MVSLQAQFEPAARAAAGSGLALFLAANRPRLGREDVYERIEARMLEQRVRELETAHAQR